LTRYKQQQQQQYYQNFLDSQNKSELTKQKYIMEFNNYLKYLKVQDPNTLITEKLLDSPKEIRQVENQIRDYIKYLGKVKGWGYKAVLVARSSIFKFYEVNRVNINRKYFNQFMPAQRKLRNDKAYTHRQIEILLNSADKRDRVMILLMASTGMRIGALSQLTIGNLTEMHHIKGYPSDSHIYKIVVYESEREEYYTFCSFECAVAIKEYLEFRANAGEDNIITNLKAPLLREKFNSKDKTIVKKPQFINHKTLHTAMYELLIKSGLRIRTKKEDTHSYETMESHGLRKFCITQMKNTKVDFNDREYLVGHRHSRGLDVNYDRTTEEDRLQEYLKAMDLLTISPENRLRKQVAEQEHTIQVRMAEKDKQIEEMMRKQEQFEQLIQSLIDSKQLKPVISDTV
jgi:integrase